MKRVSDILDSIRRGLRRPEVRRHPVQAVTRRLAWRWHWKRQPDTPIVLKDWWRGLSIVLPHTGNSSLVFYRRHSDEGMVWLLQVLLSPGMTFLDVGAHIGEFTLVGAEMVGAGGKAVAVEPLPPCAETIRKNAALNRMNQVAVFTGALSDRCGKIGFVSDSARSSGWIAKGPDPVAFESDCWTLDELLSRSGMQRVAVLKLDTNGNELAALRGGAGVLREGRVGNIVMKLYHPDVTRSRFGYDAHESVKLLREWGFLLKIVKGHDAYPVGQPEDIDRHFNRLVYCHLLVATKA